jgi:hypothetical protein
MAARDCTSQACESSGLLLLQRIGFRVGGDLRHTVQFGWSIIDCSRSGQPSTKVWSPSATDIHHRWPLTCDNAVAVVRIAPQANRLIFEYTYREVALSQANAVQRCIFVRVICTHEGKGVLLTRGKGKHMNPWFKRQC